MDQQIVDDIECTEVLNKKTLSCSITVFLQYIASMKIFILQDMLIANYTDNMQLTRIDCLHTAKNTTARVDSILRVKYGFACNDCSERYASASAVLYKRYLDSTAISLGLLFFF